MGLEVLAGKLIYRHSLNHLSLQAVAFYGDHIDRQACSLAEQRITIRSLSESEQEVLRLRWCRTTDIVFKATRRL